MFSGISHKTKDVNGLKTELLFSCTVVFSVGQSEGVSAWTAWVNLKLTKKQLVLDQNPCTRLTGTEYQEAFPQCCKPYSHPSKILLHTNPQTCKQAKQGQNKSNK